MCLVRSPLGGRNHETYGEDPHVLGTLGAAYVNGCQSVGVAATPKHYVANEVETRRRFLSAEVEERALREIYLKPFQLIMKGSDPWCWMTSYNRVNGTYASDDHRLIQSILRDEWSFKGLVMSDWVGTYSTAQAMNAGLDLEIPAPLFFRGEKLLKAIKDGDVTEDVLNQRVRKLLELIYKTRRIEDPEDIVEFYDDNKERDAFIAEAASEGIVLLKNEKNILPLKKGVKIAVIGQHAQLPPIMGGGSAVVSTDHVVTPVQGLQQAGVDMAFDPGVPVYGAVPLPDSSLISKTKDPASRDADEARPVRVQWFNGSKIGENRVKDEQVVEPTCMIKEKWPTWMDTDYCMRMTFDITPTTTGPHNFSVITTGTADLYIDGEKIYHREQEQVLQREAFYFFRTKLERHVKFDMQAGKTYSVVLDAWATPQHLMKHCVGGEVVQGHAIGFMEHIDINKRISDAAAAAKSSDVAVVFTGTTLEFESEGYDRQTMDLQPKEYELVDAVLAANPNTIVVNTSGSAVTLTQFADKVAGLVQMFYPGQESGTALARVLTGEVNPSGCLPVTWPRKVEDNPSHGNWPGENDVVHYKEGIYVGYRHYEKKEIKPHFAFGFGLSYSSFDLSSLSIKGSITKDTALEASVEVKNTGTSAGKVVVQFYVRRVDESKHDRPVKELKAFEKPMLEAGASTTVNVALDKYAVSIYNTDSWQAEEGKYEVLVGLSSDNILQRAEFQVADGFTWTGL